jgi:serine/threonine protein kinase
MLLADELDDEEETIAIPGVRSVTRLRAASPQSFVPEQRLPGRLEPGMLLGNYSILRCIARGGMASVWVARHRSARGLGKIVTLKTILPELAAEPAFEEMFLREARLASLIHHPNVCETFELIETEGVLALSMEWVDGASLSRMLMANHEPLDARIAARIAAQAAAGLHAAHELRDEEGRPMNLVHRDVSPQNILLSRDGHVRLSDFGIAKAMSGIRELSSIMRVQGKVSYLSPEQARNEPLDRRSDVFSLGVVLYTAALGHRPFAGPGERDEQAMARLLRGELMHPLRINPSFPSDLADIIVRSLQREPAQRYATAAEMRHDLERWLASSGPLITEDAVAQVLHERCGPAIEHQQMLIRAALSWDAEARPVEGPPTPVGDRHLLTHESGMFPSAALHEAPTNRLPPPPRPARLYRSAPALAVSALGLGALVWLLADRHTEPRRASPPQRLTSSLSQPASEVPARATPTQAAPTTAPAPLAAPSVSAGRTALANPKRPPKAKPSSERPPALPPSSRPGLGPVEREL